MGDTAENIKYDFFISFAEDAKEWVEAVLIPKLKRASKSYVLERVVTGQPWLENIQNNIEQSEKVLAIVTPQYAHSQRSHLLELMAITKGSEDRQWPVIPIHLKHVKLELFLRFIQGINLIDYKNEDQLDSFLEVEPMSANEAAILATSPYPGMLPFTEKNAGYFFGREEEIELYSRRLYYESVLVLIGSSGSGKSSLAYAGIIPKLKKEEKFSSISFRSSDNELFQWLDYVIKINKKSESELESFLFNENKINKNFLLFIDQFEEIYNQDSDDKVDSGLNEKAKILLKKIAELRKIKNIYILITLRSEFYPQIILGQPYFDLHEHLQPIKSLDRKSLSAAISQPALKKGVTVAELLVERLINEAGDDAEILPFIQETMRLLWSKRYEYLIKLSTYENLGGLGISGLKTSITGKADSAYKKLPSDEHKKIAKRIFIRLVQFNEGRPDTRRQQPLSALKASNDSNSFEETLDHLSSGEHRLLTISFNKNEQESKVDIVHEILIKAWIMLKEWILSLKEVEQSYRYLNFQAERWEADFKGKTGLLNNQQIKILNPKWKLIKEYGVNDRVEKYWQASIDYNKYLVYKRVIKYFFIAIAFSIFIYVSWIIYSFYIKHSVLIALDQVKVHEGILPIVVETETNTGITSIQKNIKLKEFMIHKYEVNKGAMCKCIKVSKCSLSDVENICKDEKRNLPMININLADAQDFCEWLGMRLPLEIEWEMAAKNIDQSILLNKVNSNIIEVNDESIDKTKDNIYGLYSNVSEWTLSEYKEGAFYSKRYWHKSNYINSVTIKGTSADYSEIKDYYYRVDSKPSVISEYIGFRCVSNLSPEQVLSYIE